ncbi:DUF2892 domain-containing protein [Fulvivirga maritima]|uniref:YgaP family membrane protein n=1 Tax=Fulvivirga maritima TaxID=2904247 RepID=UPI001F36B98A|nr:DUF2892 domain-containing protein [Fulvivirga maritima]UII26714.1 DUF2892 domain-containing protein [Fulvivirga maritima]
MKKNVGKIDKTIRILIALTIGVLYFTHVISGVTALILGVLAVIFVITSFVSICPLYLPFHINTRDKA